MKKAFTLVELLIVIVIIGILATIAIPQYQKMVDKSKLIQVLIKMDVLRKAEKVYYAEYSGWLDIDPSYGDPKFDQKMSILLLEPSDFRQDKYFTYQWGTVIFTTSDGKTHASGSAIANTLELSGPNSYAYFLFDDDSSVWKCGSRDGQIYWERIR